MRKEKGFRLFDLFAPRQADSGEKLQFTDVLEAAPDYSMDKESEFVLCPGGEHALYQRYYGFDAPVLFFDRKGERLRSVSVGFITFMAIRNGLIYSYSSTDGWKFTDLDGNSLKPEWEDYPEAHRIYDMSASGKKILYYEIKYGTGFFLKDMDTGFEIHNFPKASDFSNRSFLVQCSLSQGFFMHDGSILLGRELHFLERYDAESGSPLQGTVGISYDVLTVDVDRRHILCRCGQNRDNWIVFDEKLREVCRWSDEAAPEASACVMIPGTSRVAYETQTHLCIYDYLEARRVCAVPLPQDAVNSKRRLRVRPDGKELYVEGEKNWHVMKHCDL